MWAIHGRETKKSGILKLVLPWVSGSSSHSEGTRNPGNPRVFEKNEKDKAGKK
jgi:hypothetical protein